MVPIVVWLISAGYGLLIERIARRTLPNALLVPVGFCASVCVALGTYETGADDGLTIPVVVALAVVGLALTGRALPGRLNAGWALLAALFAYVILDASVIATGHWTMTFYNIENDSAYELVLIAHLQAHGTQAAAAPPSTADSVVSAYLGTGYPLGAQSLLGVVSGLLGVSAAVAWQGFMSSMVAIGTLAATQLSGRTMTPRTAGLAGLVAMCGALTFEYTLQGSIKEIGTLVAILSALAVIRHAIISRDGRVMAVAGIPLGAILACFNAAGVPYVGALIGSGALAALALDRLRPARDWIEPLVIGALALVVFSIPALVTLGTFFDVTSAGYSSSAPAASQLGPLFRPLPLSEISGIWLYGDYRLPVPPGIAGDVTVVATVLVFALLVPGLWRMLGAREVGPLMGLTTVWPVLVIVYPRVTPYAGAKLVMIGCPLVLLGAFQGLTVGRRTIIRGVTVVLAAGLCAAIAVSDALAYHITPVLPTDRMLALEQVGKRLGPRGSLLDSESEQFAKYFMLPAALIDGPDEPTPVALALRHPTAEYDHSFDLNAETLPFVESFPYILIRRSPVASRPPTNYSLIYENAFYALWRRAASPRVLSHLAPALVGVNANGAASCTALRRMVSSAPPGSRLAVDRLPASYGFDLLDAQSRSRSWTVEPALPYGYVTSTPGFAKSRLLVPTTGYYQLWVQGSLPRRVSVTLDGKTVGAGQGANSPGEWLSAGSIFVRAGRHLLGVARGGGGLAPGDGADGAIDAVSLSQAPSSPAVSFAPLRSFKQVCGRPVNWIEVVTG